MRYLFIDTNYSAFLDGIYRDRPELASASYEEQQAAIRAGMFGEAEFQAEALRQLGHEAEVIVPNAYPAQQAWAREHGVSDLVKGRWSFRRRPPRWRMAMCAWPTSGCPDMWRNLAPRTSFPSSNRPKLWRAWLPKVRLKPNVQWC